MLFQSRGENRETKIFQRPPLVGAVANRLLIIWILCLLAQEAANILNLLVSRWEQSLQNVSGTQFAQQYTSFHCEGKVEKNEIHRIHVFMLDSSSESSFYYVFKRVIIDSHDESTTLVTLITRVHHKVEPGWTFGKMNVADNIWKLH